MRAEGLCVDCNIMAASGLSSGLLATSLCVLSSASAFRMLPRALPAATRRRGGAAARFIASKADNENPRNAHDDFFRDVDQAFDGVKSIARQPKTISEDAAAWARKKMRARPPVASASMTPGDEHVAALAFDLETTGLDVRSNEIVQIAIVVANSRRGAKFSALVLPEGPIDPGASNVHGFTREVLIERGARPFAEVWAECEAWLAETLVSETRPLVWAAHNGNSFDRPILTRCVDELTMRNHASAPDAGAPDAGASPPALSPLLRSPRASWVDTLQLARAALPNRRRAADGLGPHTLGSLYRSASGGGSLAGAHDALVDAEALALVWRWLVEETGADRESIEWPEASGTSPFQDHLQYHGYQLGGSTPKPRKVAAARARKVDAAATRSKARASSGGGGGGGAGAGAGGDDEVTRVSGIGKVMAARLKGMGIASYSDLERVWQEEGRDGASMKKKLSRGAFRLSPIVINRAVKGMGAEWGTAKSR